MEKNIIQTIARLCQRWEEIDRELMTIDSISAQNFEDGEYFTVHGFNVYFTQADLDDLHYNRIKRKQEIERKIDEMCGGRT